MAEAAGLVVGVVGLAALFNNAVECFDYVQLGRKFGKDFQTCQLKLDNAKLRLSRWGAALGLNEGAGGRLKIPPQEMAQAEALMGQILELFADAEGISDKFKCQARTDVADVTTDLSLAVCDPRTDLDPALRELHEKMRELAITRQKQTGLRQKAKWALYEKKNFTGLLEDITELVDALVNLFSASQSRQRELCESEVAVLGGTGNNLSLLRDIAAQQDRLLETVINNVVNNNITTTFQGPANGGFQVGYNTGPINTHIHHPERPATPPSPCSTIPFLRDRDFVVRQTILDQINEKATPGFWAALVGLGGVGKSQLAIEHGYRIRDQRPETWVFWVYASNSARFEESYREIAERAKIPKRDETDNILKLVYDWLCNHGRKWVIILDNADEPDFLLKPGPSDQGQSNGRGLITYLPKAQNGSVLITTRSRQAALQLVGESDIIPVEPMDETHAIALLRTKLGSTTNDGSLANLAEALEFMPLAIAQAAAYISQRAPRVSVEQYFEKFQKSDSRKTSLLSFEGGKIRRDTDAKNSVITTWQISFEHIRERRRSATDLLSYMSFFDRQGIPEFMLHCCRNGMRPDESASDEDSDEDRDSVSSTSESSEDDGFENDLQVLRDYSFISVGGDPSLFEMHRLVQLATRKWLKAHGAHETWKQQFIRQLSANFPDGDYKTWAICQVLFPHAKVALGLEPEDKEVVGMWTSLLGNAAEYTMAKGNTADSDELAEKSLEVCKKVFGDEDALTLDAMGRLGLSCFYAGKWAKAAELLEEVVEKRKRLLGEEDPTTLVSLGNLSAVYTHLGRLVEVEEIGLHVLERTKVVRGAEDPDTLTTMSYLARTYAGQERWKESQELAMEVLEIRKRVLGLEHPNTLTSMGVLADAYTNLERLEEATELEEQVLEIHNRILGAEHPNTLTVMHNLAVTYRDQGRLKEAEELGVKAMEMGIKVDGREHPATLSTMAHVALTYWEQGRWEEAEKLETEVFESRKRLLGPEHKDTLRAMNNLACTWKEQGKVREAIDLMVECLQLSIETLGPEHRDTLYSSKTLELWRTEIADQEEEPGE
ncbi:kinesin light chain [Arthroderma uncinatum]|uniref:kinesin light chain n=1 Tax=Arthroderma uncinatum TaxID=74035 RepID=UPI00144AD835|nr:kinesin light chain [Arthroderma uncinatum]KAF3481171.1 kinesin light chain [Arthroderma uncinatum]